MHCSINRYPVMRELKQLAVTADFGSTQLSVGRLVLEGRRVFFRYAQAYLNEGYNLSPFKLRWTTDTQQADTQLFDGLFGVFADALPDGWGRLLLDRSLATHGTDISTITSLDRLAYVGDTGMGALTFRPVYPPGDKIVTTDLDAYATAAGHILAGQSTELLDELVAIGGSSGGARPKIVAGLTEGGDMIVGPGPYPVGYSAWLIKFQSSTDMPQSARMEWAYYRMALEAGVTMGESKIISTAAGNDYFATRRFDRPEEKTKLHLHSAAGLLHDNFRSTNLDYGHLMDAAFRLENSVEAYERVLRLAAFNVFAHNLDDHSKNFSFLMDASGRWSFAPAYDLTFSPTAFGHHATTVAGVSLRPGVEQLMELAHTFGVDKGRQLIEEVRSAIARWPQIAQGCGLEAPAIRLMSNTIL